MPSRGDSGASSRMSLGIVCVVMISEMDYILDSLGFWTISGPRDSWAASLLRPTATSSVCHLIPVIGNLMMLC